MGGENPSSNPQPFESESAARKKKKKVADLGKDIADALMVENEAAKNTTQDSVMAEKMEEDNNGGAEPVKQGKPLSYKQSLFLYGSSQSQVRKSSSSWTYIQ